MTKKGFFGIGVYPFVILIILILGIILMIAATNISSSELTQIKDNNQLLDSGMTTRTILSYQLEEGYRVYDLVLQYDQEQNEALLDKLNTVINQFDVQNQYDWYVRIGDTHYHLKRTNTELQQTNKPTTFDEIPPGVILPGNQQDIPILIERTTVLNDLADPSNLEDFNTLRVP